MIAFLQYLVALLVAQDLPAETRPVFDPGGAIVAFGVFCGVAALLASWLRGVVERDPGGSVPLLLAASNAGRLAALGTFWLVAQTFGWTRAPEAFGVRGWFAADTIVRVAPFFVLLGVTRAAVWYAGTAAADRPPTLLRSLAADARMSLLSLAPLALFVLWADLAQRADRSTAWGRAWTDWGGLPSVRAFVTLGVVFTGMLFLPHVLARVWKCRPLPVGALRDRLERYAARTGFRAREILVWPTGGRVLNAAVVGMLPRFRYVFLTDGLLETLPPDEVEAVFAHEAGHARRGHVLLFLGYTAIVALAAFLPGAVLGPLEAVVAPLPPLVQALLVVVVWFGFLFGWVSRRFEQEADVHGIDTIPAPRGEDGSPASPGEHPFAKALERLGVASGGIREITGWRHDSIAVRVAFVRSYLTDPAVRRRYRRQILLLRGVLIGLVAVTALSAAARVPFDIRESGNRAMLLDLAAASAAADPHERAARLADAARAAERTGRTDAALRWYEEAARLGAPPAALRDWAVLLGASGRPLGARAAWAALAARDDAPAGRRATAAERAAEALR